LHAVRRCPYGGKACDVKVGQMTEVLDNPAQNRGSVNPMALTLADAARLLSAAGGRSITVAMLQADIDLGAPINGDGTINLIQYGAWLVKEASARGD
jgi:hypothetical protein